MELLFSELVGAMMQLVMFAMIPFVWWLITARKKAGFFSWIGLKKIRHEGKWMTTGLIMIAAIAGYTGLTGLIVSRYSEGITMAGSGFAGKGAVAIPAILAYGYIRTGLAEELLFRGFLEKRISSRFGFAVGNAIWCHSWCSLWYGNRERICNHSYDNTSGDVWLVPGVAE